MRLSYTHENDTVAPFSGILLKCLLITHVNNITGVLFARQGLGVQKPKSVGIGLTEWFLLKCRKTKIK